MNRFHNKYHRHNHHTLPAVDEPDSSHDPIASPSDPFQGDFHINGALSAKQGIFDNLTFSGTAAILDQLLIKPKIGTTNYYVKISSVYNNYPLLEMYYSGNPIFVAATSGKIGINTSTPRTNLDIVGDTICNNLSSSNIFSSGGISAISASQLGYLEIGYSPASSTNVKSVSGNRDIYFYTGSNLNLKLIANGNNIIPGKLGIKTDTPVEPLTINGNQSFRKNGIVLIDNSYYNTLRIINNRQAVDDNHLFTFAADGRYIVGDVFHDTTYTGTLAIPGGRVADHKISNISTTSSGKMLSLVNFTPNVSDTGPVLEFFRGNGPFTFLTSAKKNQLIGGVRAYGYDDVNKNFNKINSSIEFKAASDFTGTSQGSYITLNTVCSADTSTNIYTRMTVADNGRVGIGTSSPASRLHIVDGDLVTGTGAGTTRDLVTLSTANDLNGILFAATSVNTRLYMQASTSTFNIDVGTGTNAFIVYSNGNAKVKNALTVATTNYSSDERLKLNKKPISNSLEKIENITGITFNWDETKQDTQKGTDVGVVAQEIEKVLPFIVNQDEDGYKTVQYHKLIPLLIEGIKELKRELDTLKFK